MSYSYKIYTNLRTELRKISLLQRMTVEDVKNNMLCLYSVFLAGIDLQTVLVPTCSIFFMICAYPVVWSMIRGVKVGRLLKYRSVHSCTIPFVLML
jgi:hypothetical protein